MKALALSLLTLATAASGVLAEIPDRPEKLSFSALSYDPPKPADYRVQLKAGPVAYIATDRALPLVTISVMVRCGAYLEPEGKEGLADFTGHLLVRGGIASKSAEELEERLAFLAAGLSSGIGDDSGSVSLNLLSKDLPEGLALLREVLTAPRFQKDKFDLHREQSIQGMKQRNDDSGSIQAMEAQRLAYGTNFWASRISTEKSLNALSIDDLKAYHQKWFHPANFVVSASGDFDRDELIAKLETLFANWPFTGEKAPPVPANPTMAAGGVYLVDKDVNQGRVSVMLPGVKRDDPDFPAITVMNDILGGGGFTSRLMNRVRSDEGLAYGAGSSFPGTFNTKAKIAGQFAADEFTGRFAQDPEYWSKWRSRIETVSKDDVLRVAKQHLHPDKAVILVVGQKEEILKGHPDHPVKVEQLASGKVTQLPLRDPLTQEPVK